MIDIEAELENKVDFECFFRELSDKTMADGTGHLFWVSRHNDEKGIKIPVIAFDDIGVYPYPGEQIRIHGKLKQINIDGTPYLGIYLTGIAKQTKIKYTGGHCYDDDGNIIKWWENNAEMQLKRIGAEIRQARRARGLTQTELGKMVGVKAPTIQKYEYGIIKNIPLSRLIPLLDKLGLKAMIKELGR